MLALGLIAIAQYNADGADCHVGDRQHIEALSEQHQKFLNRWGASLRHISHSTQGAGKAISAVNSGESFSKMA
jgi:hypothetical protein